VINRRAMALGTHGIDPGGSAHQKDSELTGIDAFQLPLSW
jgi:hypothetical protein